MRVSPLSLDTTNNTYSYRKDKTVSVSDKKQFSPSFKGIDFHSYGESLIYMFMVDKLKKETQEFPNDVKYRQQLMVNAGLNPKNQHKLRSIIGPDEIKSIMSNLDETPSAFEFGEKGRNVVNGTMRANMHIHTTASDGSLTVTELLDKAAAYADNVKKMDPYNKEPFVVAITDHDTTEGAKEAIKVISDRPLKYKNLRVILGVEMTTFNNIAQDIVSTPTNTHVLVYGIDPNEKRFDNFIEITKAKKNKVQESMTQTANNVYKKHFGTDGFYNVIEAKHQYNTLNKNLLGTYNAMDAYFENKIAIEHVILKDKKISSEIEKHNFPTDTEGLMVKLSEFHAPIDGNNKIRGAADTIPDFISAITGISKEEVGETLDKGMQSPKIKAYLSEMQSGISKFKITFNPTYHYAPNFETLYNNLSEQKNAFLGIAHPIDTVKNVKQEDDKYKFLTELYSKFKSDCREKAVFSEAYYQSYKPGRKEFNFSSKTQMFLDKLSKLHKLFRTGSADTHGLNIFLR